MPTVTDRRLLTRRSLVLAAMSSPFGTMVARARPAAPEPPARLLTAWDDGNAKHWVGILRVANGRVDTESAIEEPTRAHDLCIEADGAVLVVARRPGEWLLRWRPGHASRRATAQWHWSESAFRFNGHVLQMTDGKTLLTTETDIETGAGYLVRRDQASLAATARWPTMGLNPHDLQFAGGQVLVANGGLRSEAETGRTRHELYRMDSSIVALDPVSGAAQCQWRLADPRLSLRHMAVQPGGMVAVAMQAQHDDPVERGQAPVLALLDMRRSILREIATATDLGGYAGDVAATIQGWIVSCPKTNQVLYFSTQGKAAGQQGLANACAIASTASGLAAWATGRAAIAQLRVDSNTVLARPGIQFDNHACSLHMSQAP